MSNPKKSKFETLLAIIKALTELVKALRPWAAVAIVALQLAS